MGMDQPGREDIYIEEAKMMIVRYSDGTGVTYNNAGYVRYLPDGGIELYTKKDGGWIATVQASAGATIEAEPACKVENPLKKLTGEAALDYVLENIHDLTKTWNGGHKARGLKRKLANFSTRSLSWRVANKESEEA